MRVNLWIMAGSWCCSTGLKNNQCVDVGENAKPQKRILLVWVWWLLTDWCWPQWSNCPWGICYYPLLMAGQHGGITCSQWEHWLCIQCEGIGLKGFYILSDVPNWISRLSCWKSCTLSLNGITLKLNHHVRSSGVMSGRTRDCHAILFTSELWQLGYQVLLHIKRRSHGPQLMI